MDSLQDVVRALKEKFPGWEAKVDESESGSGKTFVDFFLSDEAWVILQEDRNLGLGLSCYEKGQAPNFFDTKPDLLCKSPVEMFERAVSFMQNKN